MIEIKLNLIYFCNRTGKNIFVEYKILNILES